jgi:hypothetical protein
MFALQHLVLIQSAALLFGEPTAHATYVESRTKEDLAPGDEASEGTEGAGENICPDCNGSGVREGEKCPTCEGTGRVIEGIGGG